MAIIFEILTFIVVLVVLILVHELGHFIVAKFSGMRVDEFGFGYPPRALTLGKIGETEYTLNWLPFGGFVRIYGEDGTNEIKEGEQATEGGMNDVSESEMHAASPRAFSAKPRILQALTLIAGVAMNILLAYILITSTLIIGVPQVLSDQQSASVKDAVVTVSGVNPGTPAAKAGFMAGDKIRSEMVVQKLIGISYNGSNPQGYSTLTAMDTNLDPIRYSVDRNGKMMTLTAVPATNIIPSDPTRVALGFSITSVGTVKTSLAQAPIQGAITTWAATRDTALGLFGFFKNIALFKADLSQVSGPIGIAGAVGNATSQGLSSLLWLTALISINLAIINLLPIPALDGGRLLFVIIEAIIRRPLNPKIAERVNMIGFGLLILLMLVVSAHDIFKLFV
jgi:regulator of sigma E protease